MKKEYKYAYIALIAACVVLCIASIAVTAYSSAILLAVTAVYTFVIYKYNLMIGKYDNIVDNLFEEINRYSKALTESEERERLAKQELAKMRKRLEVTEAARKELEEAYHNELQKNAQRARGIKHPSKV